MGVAPELGGRERNEDNYLICQGSEIRYLYEDEVKVEEREGDGMLLVICDGMGGHDDGHIASRTAARVMAKLHQKGTPRNPARELLKFIQNAHNQIYWRMRDQGPVTMGTTLTACWILDRRVFWSQVGDSHLYLWRNGDLRRLTPTHTRNEFAMRDGLPTSPDGNHLCQNFIYGSRGVADNTALRLEPGLDNGVERLDTGDRLLLATDGLWGTLSESFMAQILKDFPYPQQAAEALMERAIQAGSDDNITAVITVVGDEEENADAGDWDDDDQETVLY